MSSNLVDRASAGPSPQTMDELGDSLHRLSTLSQERYYNPYETFDWPDTLPDDQLWMSPELMSTAGTDAGRSLSEEQMIRLSHEESINFYTLNVYGIRQLMVEVINRIHTPRYGPISEFLHHFVKEENEHMWFFAEFCRRYGSDGLYPDRQLRLEGFDTAEAQDFLAFARIMMFEEIGHRFNARMADDERLPAIVRCINQQHHQDESRHIAFGRRLVNHLFAEVGRVDGDGRLVTEVGEYCRRFLIAMIQSLYNPAMYAAAGIDQPFEFRRALLADPGRQPYHQHLVESTVKHLDRIGALDNATFELG